MIDGLFAMDYQVHSFRSHDGKASIREHCLRAVEIGLDELAFTEHKDFDPLDPVVGHFDYERFLREVEEARQEFGEVLAIRLGVEIDYQRWFERQIERYLRDHPFDFVMASVHYVRRVPIMSEQFVRNRSAEQAYAEYFDAVRDSVESGLFDVVGHLEYANRRGVQIYGRFRPEPYREQVTALFDAMIEREIALEINTAGLRQGVNDTYPCEDHIALYAERGGKLLTIGSDAHVPQDLAYAYPHAAKLALRHGLDSVCTYSARTARAVPLIQDRPASGEPV